MTKQQVAVVLDLNEHMMNPELHDILDANPDVQSVTVTQLEAADIVVGDVGIERKSWSDYVASMEDGRFAEQDAKMGAYDAAYILVEGDLADTETLAHTQMSGASIRGHMASLTARDDYNVLGVIPCSTLALLADYAVRLGRKHTEDPSRTYIPTGTVGVDEPSGKQMWGCLDGVGPELAGRLYAHYGSPASFMMHNPADSFVDDLMRVEGIGEERAEAIMTELSEK